VHLVLTYAGLLASHLSGFFVENDVSILGRPRVETNPNRAEFCDRTENGSTKFINIMIPGIGATDKFALCRLYCKLNLTKIFVLVQHVDENIICAELQPVLYSNNFHKFWLSSADILELFVNVENLSFLRGALAPHQIPHFEGQKVWRRSPSSFGR